VSAATSAVPETSPHPAANPGPRPRRLAAVPRTVDLRTLLDEATVLAVFAWVFSTHRRLLEHH